MRKSFILHLDSLEILDDLTNEQAGKLLKAMRDYNLGNEVELDPITKMCFLPFKNQFIRDIKSYEEEVLASSEKGKLGNLKRWHYDLYIKVVENQISIEEAMNIVERRKASPPDTTQLPPIPKSLDSKNKSDSKSDSKNKKETLDFSFVNEKVIDDFKAFVEHRKAIKHPIKTQDQLERLYANLKKLSNSKAEIASEILNNSIVNGWQGIFELKKKQDEPKPLNRITMNS